MTKLDLALANNAGLDQFDIEAMNEGNAIRRFQNRIGGPQNVGRRTARVKGRWNRTFVASQSVMQAARDRFADLTK